VAISRSRVVVNYKVVEKAPKSKRSRRVLALDDGVSAGLAALAAVQFGEALNAGTAYSESGYVVVDELGAPLHPEAVSDLFLKVSKAAGCPRIRLHDGRHTALSQLMLDGVPVSVVSKWAGHASVAFTLDRYVVANDSETAAAAEALTRRYATEQPS
jgi:integrase